MTYSEIIPGNCAIANFLGAAGPDLYWLPQLKDDYIKNEQFTPSELRFHTDWNWLMLAIERIDMIITTNCKINYRSCSIISLDDDVNILEFGDTKIQAVWKAVVNFIKWYNAN